MTFREFGSPGSPPVILLHGGGLSWWSVEPAARILEKDFYVVTPVIDGHGEDGETTFVSIGDSAEKLVAYIQENLGGRVFGLCGLSIGAQIVVETLSTRPDICDCAVVESALVFPIRFLTACMIPLISLSFPLIKNRAYSRIQAKSLFVPEEKLEPYYRDSCRISRRSLLNITKSNGSYELKPSLRKTGAKVLVLAGEKEPGIMKKSARLLHETIPGSTLRILPGFGHGELSLLHPDRYCEYFSGLKDRG